MGLKNWETIICFVISSNDSVQNFYSLKVISITKLEIWNFNFKQESQAFAGQK